MWCLATRLAAVISIAYLALTKRIRKDQVRFILDKSGTKYNAAATNAEGQGGGLLEAATIGVVSGTAGVVSGAASIISRAAGIIGSTSTATEEQAEGRLQKNRAITNPVERSAQAPEYVISALNSNACTQGSHPITDVSSCRAAAHALGSTYGTLYVNHTGYRTWATSGVNDTRPHGCHGLSIAGDLISVYYNTDPVGSRNPLFAVICRQAQPRFVITSSNDNVCDEGSQPIADASACRDAARELGFRYMSSGSWTRAPYGCYINRHQHGVSNWPRRLWGTPRAWYNTDAGTGHSSYEVICQPSFARVGMGYCANGGKRLVGYALFKADSLSDCKTKCADTQECHAIVWGDQIVPPDWPRDWRNHVCELFHKTCIETTHHAGRDPGVSHPMAQECWNKNAKWASKFDRVKVVKDVTGPTRHRWTQEGDESVQLFQGDFGTLNLVCGTGKVSVILDKDVEKEVGVHQSYLVKDDPALKGTNKDTDTLIQDVLKNFPRAEDMAIFKCPITKEFFRVPVVASDGRTYENSTLQEASKGSEPVIPNYAIKSLLKALAEKVEALSEATLVEASFIRVGYGWCADQGHWLSSSQTRADSLSDCKTKCADYKPCRAINYMGIQGEYGQLCHLFNRTFVEANYSAITSPVPECWNKQASNTEELKYQILNNNPPVLGAGAGKEMYFKCPISLDFFTDPVVASDGHTYDRDQIKRVLQGDSISPVTREDLSYELFANRAMKSLLSVLLLRAHLIPPEGDG